MIFRAQLEKLVPVQDYLLIRVALLANSSASVIRCEPVDWSDFRNVCLREHFEQPKKDGAALIFADLHGGRCDENVDSVCAAVYDIDGKLTEPEVDCIVAGLASRPSTTPHLIT